MAPPKKKAKRDASDESEPDSEEDETVRAKHQPTVVGLCVSVVMMFV